MGNQSLLFNSASYHIEQVSTRKDDMISLGYSLLYLLDKLPFEEDYQETNSPQEFYDMQRVICKKKMVLAAADYCDKPLTKPLLKYM